MTVSCIQNSPLRNMPYVWNLIFTVLKQYKGNITTYMTRNKKIHKHKESINSLFSNVTGCPI